MTRQDSSGDAPMSSPPPVRLVLGRACHRDFVRRLSAEVFARFGDYESWLPSLMERSAVRTVVAVEEDRPVGFAMHAVSAPEATALVDLVAIAVRPERQSRGVGRLLLRHVEEAAARAARPGAPAVVHLTVAEDNARARRLFDAAGYLPLPGPSGAYAGGQRSIRMVKLLASRPSAGSDR